MKNLKIIASAFLTLCSALVFAEQEAEQKTVLSSLDSIEKNTLGFAVNGFARGGMFASFIDSDSLPNGKAQSEYMAFTDFLLSFSIRPSSETRALFDLRMHKDWQSAYREGDNVPIITWWSYDGLVLDKKLSFNLGTMRVGYTPLTISTPNPDLIFEPRIFADRRAEVMADRYLDGSEKRLMQGLNAELNFPVGPIDNILIQATIARLRNNAKKGNQIFYDFDTNHDRYATAARFGLEAFGVSIGVNDVYSFDRVSSNRSKDLLGKFPDSANYEFNNVLSFAGGIDSKKWLSGAVSFGANAEFAISNWIHYRDIWDKVQDKVITLEAPQNPLPCGQCPDTVASGGLRYPYNGVTAKSYIPIYRLSRVDGWENQSALLADAFVNYSSGSLEAKLSGHYLKTDVKFESELAASPSYLPMMPILNSNAVFEPSVFDNVLGNFRSGSLESMYSSLYYTLPLNAASMVFLSNGALANPDQNNLYNNYKFGHYYRNAYSYLAYTRLERDTISAYLDPSVNMALPYGYATPDRKGGDAALSINWDDAILLRGIFGKYASETSDYTRLGGGLLVKIGRLADLPKPLDISASYEQNKEKDGLEREAARIMAGFDAGIWRGLSLIGGVQLLDKKFGVPYEGIVEKTSEMLVLGGPSIKMSEMSSFVLQGGLLSNSISAVSGEELDISKYLVSGIVKVGF
jgi:hypothetical protein